MIGLLIDLLSQLLFSIENEDEDDEAEEKDEEDDEMEEGLGWLEAKMKRIRFSCWFDLALTWNRLESRFDVSTLSALRSNNIFLGDEHDDDDDNGDPAKADESDDEVEEWIKDEEGGKEDEEEEEGEEEKWIDVRLWTRLILEDEFFWEVLTSEQIWLDGDDFNLVKSIKLVEDNFNLSSNNETEVEGDIVFIATAVDVDVDVSVIVVLGLVDIKSSLLICSPLRSIILDW